MSRSEDRTHLAWPGGPSLTLARATIHAERDAAASDWKSGTLRDRLEALLRWHPCARRPLTGVKLEFDGKRLLYLRTRHEWDFWEVPPEQVEATKSFVEDFHQRREDREKHRAAFCGCDHSRGRSALPWLVLLVAAVWLIRRARRR